MTRFRAWALAMAMGATACPKANTIPLDPDLPDGETFDVVAPRAALVDAAAQRDPQVRGPALAALVRQEPAGELVRWAVQGTYDPEPWVQRRVVQALLERDEAIAYEQLQEYVARGSADPYVRAHTAHALLDLGRNDLAEGVVGSWQGKESWRAAPLALAASRFGEEGSRAAVEAVLARAQVRGDREFFTDVGRYGWPELAGALLEGIHWGEDEVHVNLGLAAGLLGDGVGKQVWVEAVRSSDPFVALEAFDLVWLLPLASRGPWAAEAKRGADPTVRTVAGAVAKPTAGAVAKLAGRDEPYARRAALKLVSYLSPQDVDGVIGGALEADDVGVRVAACAAAVEVGAVGLAAALTRAAQDDKVEVRVAAYGALYRLGIDPTR